MFLNDDFGWALYCPLLLKGGMAKPDLKEIKSELDRINELKNPGNPLRKRFEISPFVNDSKNRIRYLNRILELKPSWGDINQYISPINNYEGITFYVQLPTVKIDLEKGDVNEQIEDFVEMVKKIEKEQKDKKINTGFYDDSDWYPDI